MENIFIVPATIMAIIFILVSLMCFKIAFNAFKNKRIVEDIPTSKIRSAAQGYTEIIGKTSLSENYIQKSPLTEEPCLWFESRVYEWTRFKGKFVWKLQKWKFGKNTIIPMEDETGICFVLLQPIKKLIQLKKPKIYSNETRWYGNNEKCLPHDNTDSVEKYNSRDRSIDNKTNPHNYKYRFEEQLIKPDEEIYVIGNFKTLYANVGNVAEDDNSVIRYAAAFFAEKEKNQVTNSNHQIHTLSVPDITADLIISTGSQKDTLRHQGTDIKAGLLFGIIFAATAYWIFSEFYF